MVNTGVCVLSEAHQELVRHRTWERYARAVGVSTATADASVVGERIYIDIRDSGLYLDRHLTSPLTGGIVSVRRLYLDKIQDVARVSEGKAKKLMEACVWCMLSSRHSNGVSLEVIDYTEAFCYLVSWPEELDLEAINRSFNRDDATEEGAEAIALLIALDRTEFTAVERASTATGIDYWLGYKDKLNNPFERAARLEISGIHKETANNTVQMRINAKLSQTLPTDHTFSVYVIVVEFSKPYATIVLKR